MTGCFISFEGIDGAGKSTHIEACAEWLRERGQTVILTREPGGSELAEAIRHWLLHHEMAVQTEALLAFAARSDHLSRVIRPALAEGKWVVCDRFTDSTFAYQGPALGGEIRHLKALEQWIHGDLQPARTYCFDLPPDVAASRRAAVREADRFEARDIAYFEQVRRAYQQRIRADEHRFLVLDASQRREVIADQLRADLAFVFERWERGGRASGGGASRAVIRDRALG